jgi:hypothetical protein
MKYFLIACFLVLPQAVQAYSGGDAFAKRVHNAKMLIKDFEPRSVEDIAKELRGTSSPEGNLRIFEAVAATYRDLVTNGNINGDKGKKDLYDQIRMNVAFIQFGGNPNERGANQVNRWIRQALLKYLPRDLMSDKDMFYSADDWR